MKLKTLHIENFGPVSEATVELRAINMFIGEQSIGKSTIAKLITIFTDHFSLCTLIKGGVSVWEARLKEYNLDIYREDNYRITYDMAEDDQRFHIEFEPEGFSYLMKIGDREITDANEVAVRVMGFKKIYHEERVLKALSEGKSDSLVDMLKNSLYIPAERIIYSVLTKLMPALALASSTIPKNLLWFMVELNNAKSEYPQFDIPLLNLKFKHEDSEDSIVIAQEKKEIPLTAASSGIQSLVPLLLVLRYALNHREYSSFVIEEPECNLFPTKQVELIKQIVRDMKDSNRILTVTTHSPYLLSAMNNILFAGKLIDKYGDGIRESVDNIIPEECRLNAIDCSVYSLGKEINGGVYCRSLMDAETGMIDYNSLDGVSEELSEEFDSLQRSVMRFRHGK